jgi:hypothetical protein
LRTQTAQDAYRTVPPAVSLPENPPAFAGTAKTYSALAVIAALHLAALALMLWSESEPWAKAAFVLTWGFLNFAWLAVLRRPSLAAALSLAMVAIVILLSRLKHDSFFVTASFIDVMIVDTDTISFLLAVFPSLGAMVGAVLLLAAATQALVWRFDRYRIRIRTASLGSASCLAGLAAISFAVPLDIDEKFLNENYVSKFARTATVAIADLLTRGVMESDAAVVGRLKLAGDDRCEPARKPPHIVMVLDESSFDMRTAPGIRVPPGYGGHFRSLDGRTRTLLVEGAGGPTWYTEYNVLAGLSARSYGRFADSVTRFAAGRVERGLPHALRRCGYKTFSLYPWMGNFLGARSFQNSTGIEHFLDAKHLGTLETQPDSFYFDAAARLMERERGAAPLFVFVYTTANHFPWWTRFRPELAPEWRDPGNAEVIDEYLRRQYMSERDYAGFRARLAREFPGEAFLLVRFGDHQPGFARQIVDPALGEAAIAQRIAQFDARFFSTYYAIDALNFSPAGVSSALDTIEAAHLPLVVQEAAGLPLDASFAEQKKILQRCHGLFYLCSDGAEVRRFNRLLIDAGLIKGL